MAKIIAVANQKGGVGKTTTVVAMGGALCELGFKVLLVDVDDSGNPSLSKSLCLENDVTLTDLMFAAAMQRPISDELKSSIAHHEEGYDVITADAQLSGITNFLNGIPDDKNKRLLLRNCLDQIRDNYDFVLLDAAPSLNIMSINLLAASDEILITSQAQGASEKGISELLNSALSVQQSLNPNLLVSGLLVTMVDYRTKYNNAKIEKFINDYKEIGMRVFNTTIPRSVVAEEWVDAGRSILAYAPNSKPAMAYREFTNEFLDRYKESTKYE